METTHGQERNEKEGIQVNGEFQVKKKKANFFYLLCLFGSLVMRIYFLLFGEYFVCLSFKDEKDFGFVDLGSESIKRLRWKIQNRVGMINKATFRQWRRRGRNETLNSRREFGFEQEEESIILRV